MKVLPVKGNPFADEAVPSTNYETTIVEDNPFKNEDIPSTSYTATVVEGSPFEDKEVFEPEFGPLRNEYKGFDGQATSIISKEEKKEAKPEKKGFEAIRYRGSDLTKEKLESEVEDLKAYGRDLQKIAAQSAKNITGMALSAASLASKDFNINELKGEEREKFINFNTEIFFKIAAPMLRLNLDDPKLVQDNGRILPMETLAGSATQLGTLFLGGSAATNAAAWTMRGIQNSPKIVKAASTILGFEAATAITFDPNVNAFNAIQDYVAYSEDPEADYFAKGVVDFMTAKEDDTEGTKRFKVLVEGLGITAVAGALKIIPMSYTAARQKVLGKRFDEMTKEEANAELVRYMSTVREEQALKAGAPVKETEAGLRQVEAQRTEGKTLPAKTMGYLTKFKQQFFTSRGYATPLLFEALMNSKFSQKQLITAAENTANRLNIALQSAGNNPKLLEKVSVLMETDISSVYRVRPEKRVGYFAKQRKIPEDVAAEILEARTLIDDLSKRILNTKGFTDEAKEAIQKNIGTYLRKSYKAYEDPGYVPTTVVQERAKNYIVGGIVADAAAKAASKGQTLTEAQMTTITKKANEKADIEIEELLGNTDELVDYMAQVQRVGKFYKRNESLAPEIKELLGEIKAPTDNLIISVAKASRILEMQNFYNAANQLGQKNYILGADAALTRGGRYTETITGTNSILDGKKTTPEIAMFLARKEESYKFLEADNAVINGYKYYIGVKGLTQAMKTAYSHITHARNVVGGYQFGLANGRILSHLSVSGEDSAYKVLKNKIYNKKGKINKLELDKAYEEYLGLGIINTSVNVNQFRAMMDTGFDQGVPKTLLPLEKTIKGSEGAINTAQKISKSKAYDAVINKPNELYMGSDDFFKIGAYEAELKTLREAFPNASENLLKQQAAKIVRNTMPNYDQIPKGIKAMRNLPFGNFVAFPAEIVRTSAHIVKQAGKEINSGNATLRKRGLQRLAGFVTTQVGFGTIAKFSHDTMGFSDQDVEDRRLLTSGPYSSGHDMIYTRNDDGDVYKLNTQYLNSYYSLLAPVREAYDEIQSGRLKGQALNTYIDDAVVAAIQEFTKPYITESMSAGPLKSLAFGFTSDDGRDLEGRQIRTEKGGIKWEAVLKQFKRGYAPGSYLSIEKLLESEAGKPNEYTLEYRDPFYERVAQTGFKFQRDNEEDLSNGFKNLIKDYKLLDRQNYLDRIRLSSTPEEIRKDFFETNAVDFQTQQDLYIAVQAANRQLGSVKTMSLLIDGGIPESKAKLIFAGGFAPADLPKNVVETGEKTVRKLRTEKEQSDFRNRILEAKNEVNAIHAELFNLSLDNAGEYADVAARLKKNREGFKIGGEVSQPVPNAPIEPDERINKLTGLPYNEGAGPAYMDQDDPLRALNMAAGGRVQKSAGGAILKLFIKNTPTPKAPFVSKADDVVAPEATKDKKAYKPAVNKNDELTVKDSLDENETVKVVDEVSEASLKKPLEIESTPIKTVKAYKLFRTNKNSDELYPLFVHANKGVPQNKWVKAETGEKSTKSDKHVKSKLGDLAYRPGWHSGDAPTAQHIGGKTTKDLKKPDYRPANQVWAEVDVADDIDWQSEAVRRAKVKKDGTIEAKSAHITDQIPTGGHYKYKTNPNMVGQWLISGEMRVNKKLSNLEHKQIQKDLNAPDLPTLPEVIKTKNLKLEDLNKSAVEELKEYYPDVYEQLSKGKNKKFGGGLIAKALGISDENIAWAKSIDKTYHKDEAFDGKGDAARHLALGWAAAQSKNPELSLKAINAREYVTFDGVGREMDTHNNELGFTIKANSQAEAQKEINKLIESKAAKYMTLQESKALRGYAKGGKVYNTLKKNCS